MQGTFSLPKLRERCSHTAVLGAVQGDLLKIAIPSSAGGHLTEILQVREAYDKYERFFITVKRRDTEDLAKNEKVYFVDDTGRSLIGLVKNTISSLKIMSKEKPDVIITTGAGAAIPSCIIGKLLGAKILYIESYFPAQKKKSFLQIFCFP